MAAAVAGAADLIVWSHSISDIGAGLGTVVTNLQVVIVALFLRERPSAAQLAGVAAMLTGVLIATRGKAEPAGAR